MTDTCRNVLFMILVIIVLKSSKPSKPMFRFYINSFAISTTFVRSKLLQDMTNGSLRWGAREQHVSSYYVDCFLHPLSKWENKHNRFSY